MKEYLGYSIYKILKFRIYSKLRNLKYNIKFNKNISHEFLKKNRKVNSNKSVFVFGNGPSLNIINLNKIRKLIIKNDYDLITCNSFYCKDENQKLKSDFHLMSDSDWLIYKKSELSKRLGKNFVNQVEKSNTFLQNNKIKLVIPAEFKHSHQFKKNEIIYFNDSENIFSGKVGNLLRPRKFLSMSGMKAINLACHLGYKTIYTIGIDSNQYLNLFVDINNNVYQNYDHFYSNKRNPTVRSFFSMHKSLYFHHIQFLNWHNFKKFNIVNLDNKSLVDAFNKIHSLDIYK